MNKLLFSVIVLSLCAAPAVQAQSATLLVDFSASPSSGLAPLNSVDLSASVSGTATGTITYKFDCTGDGTWEHIYTSASTSYTAPDLCSYPTQGIYSAKALVERGGISSQGSMVLDVTGSLPVPSSMSVTILAKNVSTGQAIFSDPISARPSDTIEFQIQVGQGSGTAYGVTLKDVLPAKLSYLGNLKVDGVANSGNILQGISLGDINGGSARFVTFRAQIAPNASFGAGTNNVVTTVTALGTNASGSDAITLNVQAPGVSGVATAVSTGLFDPSTLALVVTFLIGFILSYVLLLKFYVKNHILPKAFHAKAKQDMENVVERIKRREQLA
ncbi:MAG: hypothetical protein Q7S63_02235 [bacterium]|nr:hypothetical protein [bacterium]